MWKRFARPSTRAFALQQTVSIKAAVDFMNVRYIWRNLIDNMITFTAEGHLMQKDQENNVLNREDSWKVVSPRTPSCQKCIAHKCTYPLTPHLALGMASWERSFEEVHQQVVGQSKVQWSNHFEKKTLKVHRLYIPRQPKCTFYASIGGNTGAHFNNQGRYWEGCTQETYPPHIIFMGIWTSWWFPNVRRSDEVNFWNATSVRDNAERSRPVSWIFVGLGSENIWLFDKWDKADNPEGNCDRKALQIMDTHTEPGHPFIPATTIFLTCTSNSSEQSVSMDCKLIESSHHFCMFYATVKYLADQQVWRLSQRLAACHWPQLKTLMQVNKYKKNIYIYIYRLMPQRYEMKVSSSTTFSVQKSSGNAVGETPFALRRANTDLAARSLSNKSEQRWKSHFCKRKPRIS